MTDAPKGAEMWKRWEADNGLTEITVARCSGCGRGYVSLAPEGRACMACGMPVRLEPKR